MHLNELLDVSLPTSFTDLIANTKTYPPLQMRKKIQTIQANQWVLVFTLLQLSNFHKLDVMTQPKSQTVSISLEPIKLSSLNLIGPNIKMYNCIHML